MLAAIAGLVTVFVKGKAAQSQELKQKRKSVESGEPDQLELFPEDNGHGERSGPTRVQNPAGR